MTSLETQEPTTQWRDKKRHLWLMGLIPAVALFVTRPDARRRQGHLQGSRAAADRKGIVHPKQGPGLPFQLGAHGRRTLRVVSVVAKEFLTLEHVENQGFLLGANGGGAETGGGTGT